MPLQSSPDRRAKSVGYGQAVGINELKLKTKTAN